MTRQDKLTMIKIGTPLYPRDLNKIAQDDIRQDIHNHRPDLEKAYIEGEDIIIGYFVRLPASEWKEA